MPAWAWGPVQAPLPLPKCRSTTLTQRSSSAEPQVKSSCSLPNSSAMGVTTGPPKKRGNQGGRGSHRAEALTSLSFGFLICKAGVYPVITDLCEDCTLGSIFLYFLTGSQFTNKAGAELMTLLPPPPSVGTVSDASPRTRDFYVIMVVVVAIRMCVCLCMVYAFKCRCGIPWTWN